jgi:hypothetical protein
LKQLTATEQLNNMHGTLETAQQTAQLKIPQNTHTQQQTHTQSLLLQLMMMETAQAVQVLSLLQKNQQKKMKSLLLYAMDHMKHMSERQSHLMVQTVMIWTDT